MIVLPLWFDSNKELMSYMYTWNSGFLKNDYMVQNSPHDLDVRSKHDYLSLCTCKTQQVIKCHHPTCVAIHDNGDIYVGSWDGCIYVFDQRGHPKNTIGSRGSGSDILMVYPSRELCCMLLTVATIVYRS